MKNHVEARVAQTLGDDKGLFARRVALMDHVHVAALVFRHELLFFQQLEDTLDTHGPAACARRLTAKLFDQRIVAAAGRNRALRAKLVGHPLEHGQIVIIETAHETRIDRKRNVVRLQNALQAFEVRARFFAEKIDQLGRILRDFLHGRIFRVEHAQRVRVQTALRLFVEHVHVLFEVRDQLDAMRRALFHETQRIKLELDAHQAEVVPQTLAHHDDFSVGVRTDKAQRFHTDLMELAITAALRTLMTEHRADVPQALRTVVQHVVLDRRAHHCRRVFRAHCQIFTVQCVGKAVHFFLDDVGHLTDTALEQLRMLDDRRTNILVSVRAQHRLDGRFKKLPQPGFLRKDVIHALHTGQLFELFLLFSHLSSIGNI